MNYGFSSPNFTVKEYDYNNTWQTPMNQSISNDATNFNNFVQSVLVHELGHILCLADNPSTTSSSIMKYSRDRNTLTRPQTYDINDVNTKFT